MSKPTPGPWIAQGCAIRTERNGDTLAVVESVILPGGSWEANARLIAAAPDLLAALRAMVCRCEPDTDGADRRMWEDARAAIAKAEGRT